MEDSHFPHVLMRVPLAAIKGVEEARYLLTQGERIHLLHNQQGRSGLSGGPTLSLCFSPMGRPRRVLAAGLPVSRARGRSRRSGSGRQDEMGHLAPSLVALSGLLTELGMVEAQFLGRG